MKLSSMLWPLAATALVLGLVMVVGGAIACLRCLQAARRE